MTIGVEVIVAIVTSISAVIVAIVQSNKTQKNVDVQIALLEKQANNNEEAIKLQRDEIKEVAKTADGFKVLVEQNKTLFKNQDSTNEKVDKLVESMSDLKDIIIKNKR